MLLLKSNDRLQLPCVSQRILNDLVARHKDVLALELAIFLREVYSAVLNDPARLLRKVDDTAF